MKDPRNHTKRFLTGMVPLEDEFAGWGALRSVISRLMHSAARNLPMLPEWRVSIHRSRGVHIGKGVFIGADVFIDNTYPESVRIEDYVSVAYGTFIVGHFIVPVHLRRVLGDERPVKQGVVLERGCYIGPRCIITDGVTIGQCSVIGAGSVVNKSIPPYSIAVGTPAKVYKTFSREDVDFILDEARPFLEAGRAV